MWFKLKYRVCSECQVHFEPATGYEAQWPNLCSMHRKPAVEHQRRMERILEWARYNLDKLEPMMLADEAAIHKINETVLSQMANAAQGGESTYYSGLGALDSFSTRSGKHD